jgi:hypothetical protein
MLLSDVDMEILTDTSPASPWTQWNSIPEYYIPLPPFHHNAFVAPPPDSIWKTPVEEPPATRYSSGFDAPNAPSFHAAALAHWDAASNDGFAAAPEYFSNPNPLPPAHHPCPLYAMSDRIQEAAEMHWQEPPHRVATPHPSSIATLLDEFERSLTLVADEPPSFEADNRSDYNRHLKLTPARIINDELQIHPLRPNDSSAPLATLDPGRSDDHPDNPYPFERKATELLGEGQDHTPACFLNLHEPFEQESTAQPPGDPPLFEKEPNIPLKKGETYPPADLADQPPLDLVPFPTYTVPGPPAIPRASRAHPFTCPRPPTPPPSRRPPRSPPRHNTRTTHLGIHRPATTSKIDRAELPVAQASVQAGKSAQQPRLGAARAPRPPPCRAQALGDDEVGGVGGGTGWGVLPGRRTALGAALRAPVPVRRRREEADDEEGKERRVRTKRTRFVTPDAEDDVEEDVKVSPGARPPGPDSNRRTSGPGPLRSILRNKHAMPYDKATVRHECGGPDIRDSGE